MEAFGETRAWVLVRFDRTRTRDGRLLHLPQEDCCQALCIPPTLKYQSDGGPGWWPLPDDATLHIVTAQPAPAAGRSNRSR